MKNQNFQQSLLLTAIATLFIFSAFTSTFAQKGIGAKYGSRDPQTCADSKSPKTGAPSPAQAAQYVVCSSEHEVNYLYLAENVVVQQIGKGRPYNINEDINVPDIDVKTSVYAIRGSYTGYQCGKINLDRTNTNRNCTKHEYPQAKGLCYKDTFGDWHCSMVDVKSDISETDVPPPGGATSAPKDEKAGQNNQPNDNPKQTENKTEAAAGKDENGFPKPDFSAMEKWYEIVRYEYQPDENRLYVYLKPKLDVRETEFFMEFKDKDGILLLDRTSTQFSGMPGRYDAQVGDTVKVSVTAPREKILKQAVSAKVFKRL